MNSFDEFLAKRGYIRGYKHDYQVAYDYGVASQQDEVSKLQAEIDELRKRVFSAVESLRLVNHSLLYEHIDYIINLLERELDE